MRWDFVRIRLDKDAADTFSTGLALCHAMPVLKVSAECKSFLFFADVWRLYIANARGAKVFLTENSLKTMILLSV